MDRRTLRKSYGLFKSLGRTESVSENTMDLDEQNLLLYKRAKETRNLTDIFLLLGDSTEQEQKKQRRVTVTKKKAGHSQLDFISAYRFLKLMKLYQEVVSGKIGWMRIFRNFLFHCNDFSKIKIFNTHNIERFLYLLQNYAAVCKDIKETLLNPPDKLDIKYTNYLNDCESLIEYFEYHSEDPLSLLVGLQLSNEASTLVKNIDIKSAINSYYSVNKHLINIEEVLSKLIQWSNMEENQSLIVFNQLKEYVGEIRCYYPILKGELIVLQLENRFIYSRYSHKVNEKHYCYTSGDENQLIALSIDKIFPIDKESWIYKMILKYDFEENFNLGFEKLIHVDNAESEKDKHYYFKSIQLRFQKKMEEYLSNSPNLSITFVNQIFLFIKNQNSKQQMGNQFLFEDLKELNLLINILKKLLQEIPQEFLESIEAIIEEKVYDVQTKIKTNRLFQPNLFKTLKQLNKLQHENIVKANINRIIEICESAINHLKNLKMEIIDGTKKEKLVGWWLNEIDSSVQKFLESKFVFLLFFIYIFIYIFI